MTGSGSVPSADALQPESECRAIPLSGWKLTLYRVARTLGVWRLRQEILHLGGRLVLGPGFYDPFEGWRIAADMAGALARDRRDHIEIDRQEVEARLTAGMKSLRGYDADYCFRSLYRAAERRVDYLSSEGVGYIVTSGDRGQVVINIYWRRGVSPQLTTSQRLRFDDRRRTLQEVSPASIRALYEDALSQDWKEYGERAGIEVAPHE
jgi:hypothetical protein